MLVWDRQPGHDDSVVGLPFRSVLSAFISGRLSPFNFGDLWQSWHFWQFPLFLRCLRSSAFQRFWVLGEVAHTSGARKSTIRALMSAIWSWIAPNCFPFPFLGGSLSCSTSHSS